MANCEKLLAKARNATTSLRYSELVRLAHCYGWTESHASGSHRTFKNLAAKHKKVLIFVERRGTVPHYQVAELLAAIELLEQGK
jgi:predicted RNA binding protein YcfA (HicA-like mRNA interferase family)